MEFIKNNLETFKSFYFVELKNGYEINSFVVVYGTQDDNGRCLYLLDADSTNDIIHEYNRNIYKINIIEPLSLQLQMYLSHRFR